MVSPQDNSNLFSMNWEQQGQLIVEGTGPNELKPVVLSGDGTIMAIGGPGARENENRPGMVKVLRRGWFGSQWENLGRKIEGTANGDLFGTSLAFSKDGRTLAIGAPGFGERRDRPGYVRVYSMVQGTNGPGWAQLGDDIIGEANGDETGISVSLSSDGKTMAIGSSGYASSTGRVKIYSLEEGGQSWKQLGQDLDGEAVGDRSGSSVSLSSDGKMLAVGAWGNDGSSSNTRANTGHVRVHYIEEDGTSWKQLGQDIDGEDNSGRAVSFSADGKSLAVAAYGFANGNNAPAGRIRVYRMEENGLRWKQLGQEVDGEAVSLSEDGNIMAIGVAGNINSLGRVQVYVMEDDDPSWMQLGKAIEGEALGDNSRWSVNLSSDGKTVAIASHWNGGDRDKAGHVRVFTLN